MIAAKLSTAQLRAKILRLGGAAGGTTRTELLIALALLESARAAEERIVLEGPRAAREDARIPPVGSVLEREYGGRAHRVTVLADSFEYDSTRWASLSAIALAITGTPWNGLAFFGLAPVGPGLARARHHAPRRKQVSR